MPALSHDDSTVVPEPPASAPRHDAQPGGPVPAGSVAQLLALQRSAGNAAVAGLIARQPIAPPPNTNPKAGGAAGETLPISGDAHISILDQEKTWPIDLPDLGEFGIGKGHLTTEPIDLGDVEAEIEVGAHNPLRIADASIVLTPIEAQIAASVIAARRQIREAEGVGHAAVGGIIGGIAGMTPLGMIAGIGPLEGAEKGAIAAGKAAEWGVDQFSIEGTLVSGALLGRFTLVYNPYLRLNLSVPLVSKVINLNATLQTQMALEVTPSIALVGSKIGLHFEGDKLARSEFKLKVEGALGLHLDIAGALRIGATLLSIINGKDDDGSAMDATEKQARKTEADEDPGLLTIDIFQTDIFPIVEKLGGRISSTAELDMLKASPADLKKKKVNAKEKGVTDLLASGVKDNIKQAVQNTKGQPRGRSKSKDEEDDDGKDGKLKLHRGTFQDPVPIIWYKPLAIYPKTLRQQGKVGFNNIHSFPHRVYPDGLEAGVDSFYWPWMDKKFKKGAGVRSTGQETKGQADLRKHFKEHDVEWPEDEGQIDHVLDDFMGGPDTSDNLWPLQTKLNSESGSKNANQGVPWLDPDAKEAPTKKTPAHAVKANTWFIIKEFRMPGDSLPPE